MTFLGDVGGIFSSGFAIGAVLHFIMVGQSSVHRQLLLNYFRVAQTNQASSGATFDETCLTRSRANWLKSIKKKFEASFTMMLFSDTFLRFFFHCCLRCSDGY